MAQLPPTGNPNNPAPQPQAAQAQEMMPGGGEDPAQMMQQMAVQLAQTMGPEQAGALMVQLGQQIAQAGQQQPQGAPQQPGPGA